MAATGFMARLRRSCTLDGRSLAAFRMAIGTLVTADALLRTRDVGLMFAADGMFPAQLLRAWFADPCAWSLAACSDASWWGPFMLAAEAAAGLMLAAGCATRWASIAAWVAVVSVLRRTAPATNAGDGWLACLLFWSMFLPLGGVWSWDARSAGRAGPVRSTATVGLVLQIAVVYLAAGISKWNACWLSGDAVRFVMSVHDHGTAWGERFVMLTDGWHRPVAWSVLALELGGPLVLLAGTGPGTRLCLVFLFAMFHVATCLLMTVGLFGPIGLASWLAIVPGEAWDRLGLPGPPAADAHAPTADRESPWARATCLAAGGLAALSLLHDVTPWRHHPLPRPLASLVNLACMHQEWGMFGEVERQEQWAYARAELADGAVVDLLRDGRPLETERPAGGYTTLPHHRWHKLFWVLPRPRFRMFAPAIAAALARHWNDRHPAHRRVRVLELRAARLGRTAADDTLHDVLLATWPPRGEGGRGGFDRLIDAAP